MSSGGADQGNEIDPRAGGAQGDPAEGFPDVIEIVVEISRGSRNKYEWDEESEVLRLDRVLSSSVFYNFDYAFVEGTRAEDGEHTDALLLVEEPVFPGIHVWARPIGGLEMTDEHGFDFKVLCVALGDPLYRHVVSMDQIQPHRLREIENFFATYKLLEDKKVEVLGWRDLSRAREPVEAPEGTPARPTEPSARTTSTSMVGLPRESRISRASIRSISVSIASAFLPAFPGIASQARPSAVDRPQG